MWGGSCRTAPERAARAADSVWGGSCRTAPERAARAAKHELTAHIDCHSLLTIVTTLCVFFTTLPSCTRMLLSCTQCTKYSPFQRTIERCYLSLHILCFVVSLPPLTTHHSFFTENMNHVTTHIVTTHLLSERIAHNNRHHQNGH